MTREDYLREMVVNDGVWDGWMDGLRDCEVKQEPILIAYLQDLNIRMNTLRKGLKILNEQGN